MMRSEFTKETDLAKPIVEWLREMDWDVYQEVGDLNADIVAVMGKRVWIIETKLYLNFKVIKQAQQRIGRASWVSIGVPSKSWRDNGTNMASILLSHWGIGCLTASDGYYGSVNEVLSARVHRRPVPQYTYDCLDPRQRNYCEAGSPGGKAWSPFKKTCEILLAHVVINPGVTLKDAITAIDHHYASTASAKQSLATWIEAGKVPGVRSEFDKCLRLYPGS